RIRIQSDEAAAELIAFADLDHPGVVFRTGVTLRQQLLEHDGDLLAVRRAERIKLHRMFADRQFAFELRAGGGPVDVGEAAEGWLGHPDLGGRVFGAAAHAWTPKGCRAR